MSTSVWAATGPSTIGLRKDVAQLIDERRDLAAQVAGKDVEIAMALGDREGARLALREMKAQTEARRATRECAEQGPTCA